MSTRILYCSIFGLAVVVGLYALSVVVHLSQMFYNQVFTWLWNMPLR